MSYKSDLTVYHEENGQGVSIAKFVSKKRARRHDIYKPPKPPNRKRARKPKRDQEAIRRSEASMAGGKKQKKQNRKTGSNWRAKQRKFARQKSEELKNARRQIHHRSSSYYQDRRVNDKEWAEKKPTEKKSWKDRFPLLSRR